MQKGSKWLNLKKLVNGGTDFMRNDYLHLILSTQPIGSTTILIELFGNPAQHKFVSRHVSILSQSMFSINRVKLMFALDIQLVPCLNPRSQTREDGFSLLSVFFKDFSRVKPFEIPSKTLIGIRSTQKHISLSQYMLESEIQFICLC